MGFDDREKGFERKYALEEEKAFKIEARRNKLLGLWAAGKMGLSGADAEAYAKEVVMADFEEVGDADVIRKLLTDFGNHKLPLAERDIRMEMERLLPVAREQIEATAPKNG